MPRRGGGDISGGGGRDSIGGPDGGPASGMDGRDVGDQRDGGGRGRGRTNSGPRGEDRDGGGSGAVAPPIVNPIIINQSPPTPPPAGELGPDVVGQPSRPARQRSLLTMGLAETARKSLLGL